MAQNYNNNNNLSSRSSSSSSLNDNMDHSRRPPLVEHLAPPVPENFENLLLNNFGEAAHALPSGSNNNHHHAGQENESIAANQQNPQRHYNTNNNSDNSRSHEPACWVFGYGSLIWNPGFTFNKCLTGYVRGYSRRFWQGNVAHRGTVEKPGRVATLVEDKEGITWGCAYRITGDTALEYLKNRECTLGGYATLETKFFPRVASIDTPFSGEAVVVLLYIATPDNRYWLGENSTEHIAKQIAECEGPRGHNAEYLLRLAEYMHNELPDVVDEHLFDLERIVLEHLRKRKIPLESVMGDTPERIRRDSHEDIRRQPSFEFSSRVPERKLRCLNI